jgi:hypothetical protein
MGETSEMRNREKLIIECVQNGFIVSPFREPNTPYYGLSDCKVFQDIGYASAARDNQTSEECLLGFIAEHFKPEVIDK